jgi:ketosteroid isomerase-like protein
MKVMSDRVERVLAYVEAAQRARASGGHEDFMAVRAFLAPEVEIRLASPWTDEPWRTAHTGADAMVDRLRSGTNAGARLTTETVNAVEAGDDVLIEQVSTLHTGDGDKVSCVAHVFTVVDNRITRIRTYRNDAGLPTG